MAKRKTQKEVEDYCASIGVKCVSKYTGAGDPLTILCKDCGNPFDTTLTTLQCGRTHFCRMCYTKHQKPRPDHKSQASMEAYFMEHGAHLISSFTSVNQKLEFICRCGRHGFTRWCNHQRGHNPDLLCQRCLKLQRIKTTTNCFGRITEFGGNHWYDNGRMFFNVKDHGHGYYKYGSETYTFHHIFNYDLYPDLRSSLTNGFPVLTHKVHGLRCLNYRVIHSQKWFNPESWNTDEFKSLYPNLYQSLKLPHHTYPNFRFWDLSRFLITETYLDDTPSNLIKDHQTYWEDKGRIFIPVHYSTYAVPSEREAFFQYIRDSLKPFIPEIDFYTGAKKQSD